MYGKRMVGARHTILAREVLWKVEQELRKRGLPVFYDRTSSFHVTTADLGLYVSLWCGDFSKRIDIMPLRKNGEPDNRYKERSFLTPKSAATYVERFLERKSRKENK